MKEAVLQMIFNPAISGSLFLVFLIVLTILFIRANRSKKIAKTLEQSFIVFILFSSPGSFDFPILRYWNLKSLIEPPGVDAGSFQFVQYFHLILYALFLLILASRIRPFLAKGLRSSFSQSLKGNPLLWVLIFLSLLSTAWSETPEIAMRAGLTLLGINLVALYIAKQYNWEEIYNILYWTLSLFGLCSIFIHNYGNGQFSGIFYSKNALGNYMALNTILSLLYAGHKPKLNWWAIGMAIFSMVMLALSRSGGGIFTFVILLLLVLAIQFIKKFQFRVVVVLTVLYVFIASILGFLISNNLESVVGLAGKDLTLTGRTFLWFEVWERVISSHFWFGLGVYSFWQPWRDISNPAAMLNAYWQWQPEQSHQGYLDLWVQLGLVGVVIFAGACITGLTQAISHMILTSNTFATIPLILFVYVLLSNTSETQLLLPQFVWLVYILASVKLSLGTEQKRRRLKVRNRYRLRYD